ncbi:hypothetical protein DHEL01_v212641 [Diaporthe helianthi]|uniref:C2H2-type domain-containing protein n=1 Tax=Diaporthe helianthi TaxID=158607 RepID=A0A2P5HFE4_DIAHE|nr:hypothetical protein DHEL01_v212641 [Diaporthe helianthi]
MDTLRVKHVVNELEADLAQRAELHPVPNDYAQLTRDFCARVASLLLWGLPAFNQLRLPVAPNYHTMQKTSDLVAHAIVQTASFWNLRMARRVDPVKVFLHAESLSAFISDRMDSYEVYFCDHPEKVEAYGQRYRTLDEILAAKVDVEAMGEPYEIAPLPLSNGRFGCLYCNKSMQDMQILEIHHEAIHQSHGMVACTECTWTSTDEPGNLASHQQRAHDIYEAGHPDAFSTNIDHLCHKPRNKLIKLLVEDFRTRARLRNMQPPPPRVPAAWGLRRVAMEIVGVRSEIMRIPGWRELVNLKRANRVAQQ